MYLHNLDKRQKHYDDAQKPLQDDNLRRMIERGVEIPPFLRDEAERLHSSARERRELSTSDLSTECEIGVLKRRKRGGLDALYGIIGVEDDIENWTRMRAFTFVICVNVDGEWVNAEIIYHIYIGTASENQHDLSPEFQNMSERKAQVENSEV